MRFLRGIVHRIVSIGSLLFRPFGGIGRLFTTLTLSEQRALTIFLLLAVAGGIGWWRDSWMKNTVETPKFGGTYIEAVVGEQDNLEKTIAPLISSGLLRFDAEGKLAPMLAQSWEISQDGKTYTFHMQHGVSASGLLDAIRGKKTIFSDVLLEAPDDQTIKVVLKQAFSPFLASTTESIFPLGPYAIDRKTDSEVRLVVNKEFPLSHPNIQRMVFQTYSDQNAVSLAWKKDGILGWGIGTTEPPQLPKDVKLYTLPLSRYRALFFNVKAESVKEKTVRKRLAQNQELAKKISVKLVTSDSPENTAKAEEIKQKWGALGADVTVVVKSSTELQKTIIPARDYDVLLFGIDYGADPDPYPFWHSSQIADPGKNLSNFSHKGADRLMEEARLTTKEDVRKQKYDEFQKILDDELPVIFLEQSVYKFAVSERVKGIESLQGRTPDDRFNMVEKWYIETRRERKK